MRRVISQRTRDTERRGLIGAVGSAVAASLCCLGPLALLTLEPPRAVVTYDRRRVSIGDLVETIANAGYPSSVRAEGGE